MKKITTLEFAYPKVYFREEAKGDLDKAEDLLIERPHELIIKDILEELHEHFGIGENTLKECKIENITFLEFDSNKWHGAGYFSYDLYALEGCFDYVRKKVYEYLEQDIIEEFKDIFRDTYGYVDLNLTDEEINNYLKGEELVKAADLAYDYLISQGKTYVEE